MLPRRAGLSALAGLSCFTARHAALRSAVGIIAYV